MEFTGRTLKRGREYTTRGFLGRHEEFKVIRDYQGLNVNNKTFWLKSCLAAPPIKVIDKRLDWENKNSLGFFCIGVLRCNL